MNNKQPNILVVMVEHFSALADPNMVDFPVRMPNLKRLADQSVVFENAYCNSPVCSPSRLSFISGLYPCNNGVYDNGATMHSNVPTYGHLLTRGGYQTVMCGRMHIQGLDTHRGFEKRLVSDIGNPMPDGPADFPKPFAPPPELKPASQSEYHPEYNDCSIFEHDEYVTSQAVEYLENIKESDDKRPFCMTVGYVAAHPSMDPYPGLKPYYDEYINMDLPIYSITRDEYEKLPEHIQRITYGEWVFSDKYQKHQMAMYFARLAYMDEQLGQVLDALSASGLEDDTAIIFTSDHGDGMGRHGQWAKMYFYEEVQRVPFYIKAPGIIPRHVSDLVSLIDVVPTLMELSDCEADIPLDGQSLLPLLQCAKRPVEERVVFSEYHGYRSVSDIYMMVKGDYKYCHYLLEPGELYNLKDDPREQHNLIDDP
ncbi:MAG: sulfatase-like hydrolase/transferase, partial [Victivallales bacterium]|nr:sulfatase-like hydrolase/transferase [Victivallales bacterium]